MKRLPLLLGSLAVIILSAAPAFAQGGTPGAGWDDAIAEAVLPSAWLDAASWRYVGTTDFTDSTRVEFFASDLGAARALVGPGPQDVRVLEYAPFPSHTAGAPAARLTSPAAKALPCSTDAPPSVPCTLQVDR